MAQEHGCETRNEIGRGQGVVVGGDELVKRETAGQGEQVQSLMRGLALLEAFADFDGGPVGLNDLAKRVGLSPSTTHRLLASMLTEGYVIKHHDSNRYALGHRIAGTAATVQQRTSHLRTLARPHLDAIVAETGETANLVVLDGARTVYIDTSDGSHGLRMVMRIGSTFPANASASAKAILAYQRDDRALLPIFADEPLPRLASKTIVTERDFRRSLDDVRRLGYAVENDELEDGVSCISSPILNDANIAVAAIGVPGPTARIMMPEPSRIGHLLRQHTGEISKMLESSSSPLHPQAS